MAIDNLNFYSNGLPAGQLTDRYSTQPGCLRSKNLDIFSSSKSVKATAWSDPTTTDNDVIKQDGKLLLKTDGKVYVRENGTDTLLVDPSINFPVHKVSYNGSQGTYVDAQWGTVQDLVAKYEGDELKAFTVFTDRASYNWSAVKYVPNKSFTGLENLTYQGYPLTDGYYFKQTTAGGVAELSINVDGPFASMPLKIKATNSQYDDTTISLDKIQVREYRYYYDAQLDEITQTRWNTTDVSFTGDITDGISVDLPIMPRYVQASIVLKFKFIKKEGASTYGWQNGDLYVDMNGGPRDNYYMTINGVKSDGDYNAYYTYLPIRNRKLVNVGDYGYSQSYWMKGTSFQPLYKWTGSWINVNGEKKTIYDFVTDMGWETDISMDIVGMIIWNEKVYMIGNMDGNGYIIPCDLTGGKGTPYIAYGCEFLGVTNIDYLMYLVGKDRGISQLWVYNGQEMVAILGGTEENGVKNLIDNVEQYNFSGKMIEYRDDLILGTSDNRVFAYGQTYGGKGGTFIHEIPGAITDLKADGKDLTVEYSVTSGGTTTKYLTSLQDDTPIKKYNTEWVAEYPIVIGNHLLEKEETDLYASYILPSSNCKLEFWGMANHYHFRTFTSSDSYTFSTTASYKLKGCTGNYVLKYIETNGNQYTFRLEGDMLVQTTNDMKITDTEGVELISYSDFNHFRKIGEITTTEYQEGEFRFTNLNNKLELPKSYSLQIMVKGKGTANYTPELFALDLVANQRDRG